MKEKTPGVKRRKYDTSFKDEVLKMILNGRPVSEVAQSLGIGETLIYRWKSRNNKQQQPATVSKGDNAVGMEDQQALLKRIRELEQERDIRRLAEAFFAAMSPFKAFCTVS